MTVPKIINHLKMVAEKENIKYEEEALDIIAEKADGGMRDALSIFDQVASFSQGDITYEKVLEDLNVLDAENYFRIIDYSLENKVSDIMVLLNNIIARGFDGGNLINGLASHVRNVLMAHNEQTLPLLEVSERQRQKYKEQAKKCPVKFLYKALKILNECDIAYRQSSNKRLLVELTLIRVAQITQPEDDAAGAGRSPKRLKTLFKNLVVAQPKPTLQVAGVGRKTHTVAAPVEAATVPTPSSQPELSKPAATYTGPKLKISSLGTTITGLKKTILEGEKVEDEEESKDGNQEQNQFTDDQLRMQWTLMCNRMPQELVGLAARLKNITPQITDYPNVEAVVENELLLDQVNAIKRKIRATLRQTLHNSAIEFTARVADKSEMKHIFTKKEVFDNLRKQNPAIEKLKDGLGLELA
jgi:DNA polymerase-3 subunit gamma/tau